MCVSARTLVSPCECSCVIARISGSSTPHATVAKVTLFRVSLPMRERTSVIAWIAWMTAMAGSLSACGPTPAATSRSDPGAPEPTRWRRVYHETFDMPFASTPWVEDTYGDASPYHVDDFDEDGAFFIQRGGAAFARNLGSFRSFRRSFRYGEHGWLTVELYGRDSDRDGAPESGGQFVNAGGAARLISTRHYDGAIIRSTEPLPAKYRIELTIRNIAFGGSRNGQWSYDGKINGYDGDELADPWFFRDGNPKPRSAVDQNGLYFLCITDYPRPAPHNNVFIHHHRKVVMDTDNNDRDPAPGGPAERSWSKVWDPRTGRAEPDGSRYVSMLWLDGSSAGHDWFGNDFVSFTPGGWQTGAIFADKYLEGEPYRFAIERDRDRYTMSASGRFFHGGVTTYRGSRQFREPPVTWHYNQTAAEYVAPANEPARRHAWPAGSAYPDYFFFGDPHINFYEGTAEFDDLELYLPDEQTDP